MRLRRSGIFFLDQGIPAQLVFSMKKTRILLVQNAQTQGNGTKRALDSTGYDVIWVGSGVSALAAAKQWTIDLIIIDVSLPDIEGGDLCSRFRSREAVKNVPIVLLVPREYAAPHPNAQNGSGPDIYLAKPYSDAQLTATINAALMPTASRKASAPVVKLGPRPNADMVTKAERRTEPRALPLQEQKPVSAPQLRPLMQAEPGTRTVPVPAAESVPAARPLLQIVRKAEPVPVARPADQPSVEPVLPAASEDEVIDPSTGLFSRKQFEAMFAKDFKRAMRFKQQLSCMMIDLDGKRLGRAGDAATIKSIIGLVQQTIREVDTAAWWTGNELIILLPNTIRNDALQAAMRVLETVANHPFTWADSTKVTMSIGVAGLPDRFIDTEQKMLEAAAMACKRAGDLMRP